MASICSLQVNPLKLDNTSSRILNVIKNDDDSNWYKKPLHGFGHSSLSQLQSPKSENSTGDVMACNVLCIAGINSKNMMYESIRSIHLAQQASFSF